MSKKLVRYRLYAKTAFFMVESTRALAIIGCGAQGRVVTDIARASGERVSLYLDENPEVAPPYFRAKGITPELLSALSTSHHFVVAVGDTDARRRLAEAVLEGGGQLATLVHPRATIAPDVAIGAGTVVMAGAVINTNTQIGRFAVVNTGAVIDHDNVIEDNVQIGPGATLAGRVVCRADSFVGTGATIIPRIEIGRRSYVAAGAVVTRPVVARALVAGCPAKLKRML